MSPVCTNSILFGWHIHIDWNSVQCAHTNDKIQCEKWVNTFQSHPIRLPVRRIQTHTWQPNSLKLTHLSLDFIYFLVLYIHLKDKRAHGEQNKWQRLCPYTFIHCTTYILTFSTIIFGLCGIDTFLFAFVQKNKKKTNEEIVKELTWASNTCPFAICLCDQNIFWCLHYFILVCDCDYVFGWYLYPYPYTVQWMKKIHAAAPRIENEIFSVREGNEKDFTLRYI